MNLLDIAKKVGSRVIRDVVPGGGILISAIESMFNHGVNKGLTGDELEDKINNLPEDQRREFLTRQFDLKETDIKESHETLRAMLAADAVTTHSTRPYIAKQAFHVVGFTIIVAVSIWAYGVVSGDTDLVVAVSNGWPFILSAIAPLVALLAAYFGILKKEHANKLNASQGHPILSGLGSIIKKFTR